MEVVFVIDLYHGQIVHAIAGQRQNYRPFSDGVCDSLIDFVGSVVHKYLIKKIYIADLDAITQQGNNIASIVQLYTAFPLLTFWIDQGLPPINVLQDGLGNGQYVIGSETNVLPVDLQRIRQLSNVIVSLDFRRENFIGNQGILENTELWTDQIIVMSLAHVGLAQGPDYALIKKIKERASNLKVYVAGGVRDIDDLRRLSDLGVAGVLVATALHNHSITPDVLHDLI